MTDWKLENFLEALDAWAPLELPDPDLRTRVTAWVLSRFDDPYQGMRRDREVADLWYGPVPKSTDGFQVVVCTLFISEHQHVAKCAMFATLSLPLD